MKKQITAMFLALAMMLPTLTACSESTDNDAITDSPTVAGSVETTPEAVEAEAETEFTRADVQDDLPDDLNFDGQQVMVLARTKAWFDGEMFVEELNGETLNDAVFNRDTKVEDRLNVVINYDLQDNTNSVITNNVTAGVDEHQLHVGSAVDTVQYGVRGNYYNLLGEYPEYRSAVVEPVLHPAGKYYA